MAIEAGIQADAVLRSLRDAADAEQGELFFITGPMSTWLMNPRGRV